MNVLLLYWILHRKWRRVLDWFISRYGWVGINSPYIHLHHTPYREIYNNYGLKKRVVFNFDVSSWFIFNFDIFRKWRSQNFFFRRNVASRFEICWWGLSLELKNRLGEGINRVEIPRTSLTLSMHDIRFPVWPVLVQQSCIIRYGVPI